MAKFTMELREIISTFGEEEVKSWFSQYSLDDYLTSNEIALINERGTFDKEVLASRIIEHYYTREIGTDAIGQFMLFVKDKMHEVMETYAHVIYSTALKFDPLATDEHTESYVGSNDNVVNATTDSNGYRYATINSVNYCGGSAGTVQGTSNWGTLVRGNINQVIEGQHYLKVSSSKEIY